MTDQPTPTSDTDGPTRADRVAVVARNIQQRLEDIGGYRAWINDEAWTELVNEAAEAAAKVYEPMLDAYDTAVVEATRDGELEAIIDGALTTDQEIRDSAAAYSARVLQGALTRYADPEAVTAAARAVLTLAQTVEPYIRDGEIPGEGDALDAQAAVDLAHERWSRATNDEERAEVISELIGEWWAAWPRTANTHPWDALAPEIVRMTRHEDAAQLRTELTKVQHGIDALLRLCANADAGQRHKSGVPVAYGSVLTTEIRKALEERP
jgi:hypothetical protein